MAWHGSSSWEYWGEPTSQHDMTESGRPVPSNEQDTQEENVNPPEGSWITWTVASANEVAPQFHENSLQAASDQLQQELRHVRAQDLDQNTVAALRVLHNTIGTWLPATVQEASTQQHTLRTSACHCSPNQLGEYKCHRDDTYTYDLAQLTNDARRVGKILPIDDSQLWQYCRCSQTITATGLPCDSLVVIRHGFYCMQNLKWTRTGPKCNGTKGWVCTKERH
jgi:hypothetical protein